MARVQARFAHERWPALAAVTIGDGPQQLGEKGEIREGADQTRASR